MSRASDHAQPVKAKLPRRPIRWEGKVRVWRSWFAFLDLDAGCWAIGFGYDVAPATFTLKFGPLVIGCERDEPPPENYDVLPDLSWTLKRSVVPKWKLELRLEFDLNLWMVGYVMADTHDHGLYLGPLNLQIEYDKFYDYPEPRSGDAFGLLVKEFWVWLESAATKIPIVARPSGCTEQRIELAFDDITPAIGAFLTCWELVVFVNFEGRNWDVLLHLDARPRRRARGGYTCECCRPADRRVFPSLAALWRDHLFEPFLGWVNGELAVADALGLYGSPSDGYTYAKLLPEDDAGGSELNIQVAVRVR